MCSYNNKTICKKILIKKLQRIVKMYFKQKAKVNLQNDECIKRSLTEGKMKKPIVSYYTEER
jgi:hypothetical protein